MTSCCSLPVDDNGHLIEISEISHLIPVRVEYTCRTAGTWQSRGRSNAQVPAVVFPAKY